MLIIIVLTNFIILKNRSTDLLVNQSTAQDG